MQSSFFVGSVSLDCTWLSVLCFVFYKFIFRRVRTWGRIGFHLPQHLTVPCRNDSPSPFITFVFVQFNYVQLMGIWFDEHCMFKTITTRQYHTNSQMNNNWSYHEDETTISTRDVLKILGYWAFYSGKKSCIGTFLETNWLIASSFPVQWHLLNPCLQPPNP